MRIMDDDMDNGMEIYCEILFHFIFIFSLLFLTFIMMSKRYLDLDLDLFNPTLVLFHHSSSGYFTILFNYM